MVAGGQAADASAQHDHSATHWEACGQGRTDVQADQGRPALPSGPRSRPATHRFGGNPGSARGWLSESTRSRPKGPDSCTRGSRVGANQAVWALQPHPAGAHSTGRAIGATPTLSGSAGLLQGCGRPAPGRGQPPEPHQANRCLQPTAPAPKPCGPSDSPSTGFSRHAPVPAFSTLGLVDSEGPDLHPPMKTRKGR